MNSFHLIQTERQVTCEEGQQFTPLASMSTEDGFSKAHLVVDRGCYLLVIGNKVANVSKSPWMFPLVHSILKVLPNPGTLPKKILQPSLLEETLLRLKVQEKREESDLEIVAQRMPSALKEELKNIHDNGPVWAGDTVSSSSAQELCRMGLACVTIARGEPGYSATSLGGEIFKYLHRLPQAA